MWPSPIATLIIWSRVGIRLDTHVLGHSSRMLVNATEIHQSIGGDRPGSIYFSGRGADDIERFVRAKSFQRPHFRRARASHAPGLLQHARAPLPSSIDTLRNIVVAARCEHAAKRRHRGGVIGAGLVDGDLDLRRQHELHQTVKITARDDQVGTAVYLLT